MDVVGVTPPRLVLSKFQFHEEGEPVVPSVKFTLLPATTEVVEGVIEQTGGALLLEHTVEVAKLALLGLLLNTVLILVFWSSVKIFIQESSV